MVTSWLLVACTTGGDTGVVTQAEDRDGDGFPVVDDCDDLDPRASPAASESCNGRDDDCDGLVDEGTPPDAATWYTDADGDGYGSDEVRACDAPPGTSWLGDDCDDADPEVSPGADELCGGDDEDCDGEIDEAGASDATTWYVDSDGDGHGVASASWRQCEQPAGTSADAEDCDDTEASVYVDAPELCNDGLDNDCDGLPSPCLEGELSVSEADAWLVGTTAGEELGSALAGGGDLDGDGLPELVVGAPHAQSGAGAAGVFPASTLGELRTDDALAVLTASSGQVGKHVGWLGDRDGDGLSDLWISAPSGASGYGRVYLVSAEEALDSIALGDAADLLVGPGEVVFADVVAAADADGDGEVDLMVAAPEDEIGVWYVRGPVAGQVAVAEVGVGIRGEDGESFGTGLSFVDVDGDGMSELAASAIWADVVRIFDRPDEALGPDDALATITGELGAETGKALVAVDLDLDGYEELLIGAPGTDDGRGAVHVLAGPVAVGDVAEAAAVLVGADELDDAGFSLAADGDVDADGYPDVLVGGPRVGHGGGGGAWLVTERPEGTVDLADATAYLAGEDERGQAGSAVAFTGDPDRDSYDDVMLAGRAVDGEDGDDVGAVWLFLSGATSRW